MSISSSCVMLLQGSNWLWSHWIARGLTVTICWFLKAFLLVFGSVSALLQFFYHIYALSMLQLCNLICMINIKILPIFVLVGFKKVVFNTTLLRLQCQLCICLFYFSMFRFAESKTVDVQKDLFLLSMSWVVYGMLFKDLPLFMICMNP